MGTTYVKDFFRKVELTYMSGGGGGAIEKQDKDGTCDYLMVNTRGGDDNVAIDTTSNGYTYI